MDNEALSMLPESAATFTGKGINEALDMASQQSIKGDNIADLLESDPKGLIGYVFRLTDVQKKGLQNFPDDNLKEVAVVIADVLRKEDLANVEFVLKQERSSDDGPLAPCKSASVTVTTNPNGTRTITATATF
jgi:hypothetical protein